MRTVRSDGITSTIKFALKAGLLMTSPGISNEEAHANCTAVAQFLEHVQLPKDSLASKQRDAVVDLLLDRMDAVGHQEDNMLSKMLDVLDALMKTPRRPKKRKQTK